MAYRSRFQSTLSMRRATPVRADALALTMIFQSTLSMRRATWAFSLERSPCFISIHALHEESDQGARQGAGRERISIHALHEESDEMRQSLRINQYIFQSTLSMRRATFTRGAIMRAISEFQSTLSMRRATHRSSRSVSNIRLFQSTLSMRRATSLKPRLKT